MRQKLPALRTNKVKRLWLSQYFLDLGNSPSYCERERERDE